MGFMFVVRRYLSWLICAALACQLAGMIAAPVSFWCQNVATAGDDEQKCCPGLLPGQMCPMHHTVEGGRTCKMRNSCAQSDAALLALSGALGVVPLVTSVVSAFDFGDVLRASQPAAFAHAYRPESPPPRA
jgi:hypothetical protein